MPINIVCNFVTPCPAAEQAAINQAAATWNAVAGLNSAVPISVNVAWGVNLGGALTAISIPGGQLNHPMLPLPNRWYVRAMADMIAGVDLDPGQPDMLIVFDSINFNWHTGALPVPAAQLDLESVALHEMGHSLGFISLSWIDAVGNGSFGNNAVLGAVNALLPPGIVNPAPPALLGHPTVFDDFLQVLPMPAVPLTAPVTYPNPGPALAAAFTGGAVFFNPPMGPPIQIHAPAGFVPFTSMDHLNNPPATLMQPHVVPGVAVRAVDATTIAVLNALGW